MGSDDLAGDELVRDEIVIGMICLGMKWFWDELVRDEIEGMIWLGMKCSDTVFPEVCC